MQQKILLKLSDVNFSYPAQIQHAEQGASGVAKLRDVNLVIHEGERILIRGASGCGKSTLLHILAGLIPEHIPGNLKGERVVYFDAWGIVLQNPEAQIITRTVTDEIAFALENKNMDRATIEKVTQDSLAQFGLSEFAERHPLSLSGGQCQSLMLAVALSQGAQILFLDEPTSYLDAEAAREFFASLQKIDPRTTVIIVEHRLHEVKHFVNRVIEVDNEGRVVESSVAALNELAQAQIIAPRNLHKQGTQASESVLVTENLCHLYGERRVLEDVNLHVGLGEVVAIMGKSGAGKSTLLAKIAGLLTSEKGQLYLANKDVAQMKPKEFAKHLLLVPQNPEHFFVGQTVRTELGSNEIEVTQLLVKFGLTHRLNYSPFSLSEGEKRRLNLCAALALGRKLYLLDEPSYGLDFAARQKLISAIAELVANKEAAIIMVTHDEELALACADRLFYLYEGKLTQRELTQREDTQCEDTQRELTHE